MIDLAQRSIYRFAKSTLCFMIQVINEDIKQCWIHCWSCDTLLVIGLRSDFVLLIPSDHSAQQFRHVLAHLTDH